MSHNALKQLQSIFVEFIFKSVIALRNVAKVKCMLLKLKKVNLISIKKALTIERKRKFYTYANYAKNIVLLSYNYITGKKHDMKKSVT